MKEGVTRVAALRAGEVDFANSVPRESIERLSRDPQIQGFRVIDSQRIGTWLNQRKVPFRDVRGQRAVLGYGIDWPAIAKTGAVRASAAAVELRGTGKPRAD